jgi:hypothetical protein
VGSSGQLVFLRVARSLLLELLDDLDGNAVHVGDALLSEGFAHGDGSSFLRLELGGADEASLLELNEAVADVLTSGHAGVLSAGAIALLLTVVLAEGVDTDLLAHVKLVGNGGSAVEEPVEVNWGELLEAGGLDVLSPLEL